MTSRQMSFGAKFTRGGGAASGVAEPDPLHPLGGGGTLESEMTVNQSFNHQYILINQLTIPGLAPQT